ncbi:protein ANTAGONIST OF LIKE HETEROCHROMATIN PROTEIN 1-like [Patiria miniata]|uniref:Harbinger transposase-derived nuclease n=1 Tax=Patiria miniata TaxID=46514 RepID=A0A914AUC4_PATMI|nr:protein ANTAGONIST OF LIKE HETEROCHROMATIN PROTEIN 1-like [Patiria miniata]
MADNRLNLYLGLFQMNEDDSEDECETDQTDVAFIAALLSRDKRARIHGFTEEVIPAMQESEFRSHFRLSTRTFEYILNVIHDALLPKAPGGPFEAVSPMKQLLIFLWYLANQITIRELALKFGVSESTVHKAIRRVSECLTDQRQRFIRWPSSQRRRETSASFRDISGFDGIVGAIDGTHIRIMNLPGGDQDYINRKKFPSVQLQVVVDDELLITDTNVGWPGSAHDARVFRNSGIADRADHGLLFDEDQFLVGDSAYPLRPYLITVFKNYHNLTRQQKQFNKKLSSCRQVVERAIGLTKGRFRRLREVYCHQVKSICQLVTSACILHNMCILADDDVEIFVEEEEEVNEYHNMYHNHNSGVDLRNRLVESVH